jgi:hypothetical protein
MPLRPVRSVSRAVTLAAVTLVALPAAASPSVWVIDDGEKVRADATDTPFERGQDDPVWRPGDAARLFAMRNESVALQVVVEADGIGPDGLSGVTVDLDALDGTGDADGARLVNPPSSVRMERPVGAPIERFVEHFVQVRRPSGSPGDPADSEGWESGAAPDPKTWVGPVPDALIPVEAAPAWAAYPMHVAPGSNGVVWIDLNIPRNQRAGLYRGAIQVHAGAIAIASIPVELEIVDALLPDRTVAATAGYDAPGLIQNVGAAGETQLWQLLHAHRIAPLHDAVKAEDVTRQRDALDGSLYTMGRRYVGPAPGLGDGVLAIGAGGAFGSPDERSLTQIEGIADAASALHVFGGSDVFLGAADEKCGSGSGAGWRKLLGESPDESAHRVRVGWTCTQDPSSQPVDVPVLRAAWDNASVRAAREAGKTPWVYGGVLPRTGTFLLDADAVSPRVNGWLAAMNGIPRWIVPQVSAWTEERGEEPIDPFADPETPAPGASGGWSNGGGVLVYPGRYNAGKRAHDVDATGVLPSIRLKNWRRGIEDAGYLQLAREKDPARADAIARRLIPSAFGEAEGGHAASWSPRGKPFFEARRALLAVILGRAPASLETALPAARASAPAASVGGSSGFGNAEGGVAGLLLVGAVGATLVRRGRRSGAVVAKRSA